MAANNESPRAQRRWVWENLLQGNVTQIVENRSIRIRLVRCLEILKLGHQLGNRQHHRVERESENRKLKTVVKSR